MSPLFSLSLPLLCFLHWLSVKPDIKICLLIYKTLFKNTNLFICSLHLTHQSHSCPVRSNKGITLLAPRVKTNTVPSAFCSCTPALWNNLALSVCSAPFIATFRKRLKTQLFYLAFSNKHQHADDGRWRHRLFHGFRCQTLIWLSQQRAYGFCRGSVLWKLKLSIHWFIELVISVNHVDAWSGVQCSRVLLYSINMWDKAKTEPWNSSIHKVVLIWRSPYQRIYLYEYLWQVIRDA